jgi:hypothetical protein
VIAVLGPGDEVEEQMAGVPEPVAELLPVVFQGFVQLVL